MFLFAIFVILLISVSSEGKSQNVLGAHIFIFECFHGVIRKDLVLDHVNGDNADNIIANLEADMCQVNNLKGEADCNAEQKCTGNPRKYNGKMCASTTWYIDGHKGACGCGPANGDSQFDWNHSGFVAAASQNIFDSNPSIRWCGHMCGKCIKMTTTGGFVPGQGGAVPAGQSHVFMVSNLCPNEYPNLSWCSQDSHNGYLNKYGYHAHFDLEDGAGQIRAIGWRDHNPEVTYEEVNCDQAHQHEAKTPSNSMYHQCQCGHQGK